MSLLSVDSSPELLSRMKAEGREVTKTPEEHPKNLRRPSSPAQSLTKLHMSDQAGEEGLESEVTIPTPSPFLEALRRILKNTHQGG